MGIENIKAPCGDYNLMEKKKQAQNSIVIRECKKTSRAKENKFYVNRAAVLRERL
jgi:hypothetical protein